MTAQGSSDPSALTSPPVPIQYEADVAAAAIAARLLDDAFMTWVIAESECEHALAMWRDPVTCTRAAAYPAYRAAVEREEAAARDLQRLCEIVSSYRVRYDPDALESVGIDTGYADELTSN